MHTNSHKDMSQLYILLMEIFLNTRNFTFLVVKLLYNYFCPSVCQVKETRFSRFLFEIEFYFFCAHSSHSIISIYKRLKCKNIETRFSHPLIKTCYKKQKCKNMVIFSTNNKDRQLIFTLHIPLIYENLFNK